MRGLKCEIKKRIQRGQTKTAEEEDEVMISCGFDRLLVRLIIIVDTFGDIYRCSSLAEIESAHLVQALRTGIGQAHMQLFSIPCKVDSALA